MLPGRYKEFIAKLKDLCAPARADSAHRRRRAAHPDAEAALRTVRSSLCRSVKDGRGGSAAHRAVARDAVRQSLVLLKNNRCCLSQELARVHVAGRAATTSATSAVAGRSPGRARVAASHWDDHPRSIRQTVSSGTAVSESQDGSGAAGATAGVVVFGERPYAEGWVIVPTCRGRRGRCCRHAREQDGPPTVCVLISGTSAGHRQGPRLLRRFHRAWLPGTEGQVWPTCSSATMRRREALALLASLDGADPINVGDTSYDRSSPMATG